jgi:UDP-glucose 4-epimerase
MSKVLVTGGCGYIGSHTIVDLIKKGYRPASIDNLSNSSEDVLDSIEKITGYRTRNYKIDLRNAALVRKVFSENKDIEGIIHFAALKNVGESVEFPLMYYDNNIVGLLNLLECQKEYKVPLFIFSSSCSVYGNVDHQPVSEQTPVKRAESPYGRTKQICEDIIIDFAKTYPGSRNIILRYFNPAGAHDSNLIGESPINLTVNLVPVITETAIGKRDLLTINGNDYPTRDGTCIRDFIHIMDLADAHTRSLSYLKQNPGGSSIEILNLGTGRGVTVMEAVQAFIDVTGVDFNYEIGPRRTGDIVSVYADYQKAQQLLGWKPVRNIKEIMSSAWAWEKARSGSIKKPETG